MGASTPNVYLSGNCLTRALDCNHTFYSSGQWREWWRRAIMLSDQSVLLHCSGGENVWAYKFRGWIVLLFSLRVLTTNPFFFPNFKGSTFKKTKHVCLFFCGWKWVDPHCESFQSFLNGNRSTFLALAGVVNSWLPS